MTRPTLVLASTSKGRRDVLVGAGLDFVALAPDVDEDTAKRALGPIGAAPLALALAERKALAISVRHPDALTIGGDQTLACEGRLFDKPASLAEARAHLLALRGRTHTLHSAICVARHGTIVWRHVSDARLAMRPFGDAFLDRYVETCGETLLTSVGAYRLEGPGSQLFSAIDGDYFTILGLPLLPLLGFLRDIGALES